MTSSAEVDLEDQGLIEIDGDKLEYRMIGPKPDQAPTLVLLHEGLGCVALWRDFPDQLAARTGMGVFVYSRVGYGKSSSCRLPRPLTYMDDEACRVLPKVLDRIGFRSGALIGHSDGASIAAIHAGSLQDHRINGVVLMAPHFFTEDKGIASIEQTKDAYDNGDLRKRLTRYHGDNVDGAFRGWNDAWLDPRFRQWDIQDCLAYIRVPVLIIQGEDDPYGTKVQCEAAEERCYCPVEAAMLPDCEHTPQLEQTERTLSAIESYLHRLFVIHGDGNGHQGLGREKTG